ncbi:hypothetical protein [Niabella ginsengisoli]|uniref:Amidohydrolase 3 domain-containing protein n=1 Tax=Niabella ginsengisoli TaxID=522298 RepID=A0ABS9SK29_9BACT|nr:hypothetical protein [Niabella ginsengisoli]MCH5598747.1 hypothetical protein [Niabella ginsengisoli]
MKKWLSVLCISACYMQLQAQITYPVNGISDERTKYYAFTNATIVKDANTQLNNATLVIKDGKIISVGNTAVPNGAVVVDCKGQAIYPSFIDIYSDYGIQVPQRNGGASSFFGPQQLSTNTKGPFNWNQAIKSEINAYELFLLIQNRLKPCGRKALALLLPIKKMELPVAQVSQLFCLMIKKT